MLYHRSTFAFAAAALVLMMLTPAVGRSDDVFQVIVKRQEQKKLSKWSLGEWLVTRDRMRLMDMWLALHTPTPFEFYLGGNLQYGQYEKNGVPYKGGAAYLAAFASMFGLEYQRDQSGTRIQNGLFHMRVFGFHNQTTNITLNGGLRFRGLTNEFRSLVAGATTTLYFTKFFGAEGVYRRIFNSTNNALGYHISGTRYEATGFIDFSFLRVYGTYFHESETPSDVVYQGYFPLRSGGMAGVRLFF